MHFNKKKYFIIILFFFIHPVFSNNIKPGFRLIADFWFNPFIFEHSLDVSGFAINGSVMCGARLGKFTIGGEMFESYFTMTNENNSITTGWNIIRWTANGYFEPLSWFELKWGIGGAWLSASYTDSTGIIGKNQGGLSFLLDAAFRPPWEYIQLKVINRLDIFFANNSATPFYYGGIRCDFHPVLKWINLYVEVGGMTWFYNDERVDIKTGLFVWGIGVAIDMSFPDSINYTRDKIKKIKEEHIIKNKKEKIIDTKIEEFKNAKDGDIISFSNIIFFPDSDRIKKKSLPIIDKIANVLLERKKMLIEIRGHTNDIGDPRIQIKLSNKRAKMVKSYLIKKEVDSTRIMTFGFGGFYSRGKEIKEENRRVEIKILSKDNFNKETAFDKFANAKKGDIISFLNILFDPESNEITKKSVFALDKIAIILQHRKTLHIGITGYTARTGNPAVDLQSCLDLAKIIKNYIIKKGVQEKRIKIFASGVIYLKHSKKNPPLVEIKIL